jgi:hypothetical protein
MWVEYVAPRAPLLDVPLVILVCAWTESDGRGDRHEKLSHVNGTAREAFVPQDAGDSEQLDGALAAALRSFR